MTPQQVKNHLNAAGYNSIIVQDYIDCCLEGATAAYFLQFHNTSLLDEDFQAFYDTFYTKNTNANSDAKMWRWMLPDGSAVDLTFGKGL